MPDRPVDSIRVEAESGGGGSFGGVLENFTSLEITNDMTAPSTANIEIGDDGTWNAVGEFIKPGTRYKVVVNDKLRLTGRVEANDIPIGATGGATVRFVVRTLLADAQFASANPRTRVKKTSVKDFLLALYEPLGYTEADFVFAQDVARDLLTGKSSAGDVPVDLEPLKQDAAKVNPPETIFAAASRHLARFRLMHWDSPDGKIVVGRPNNDQRPLYTLRMMVGAAGVENNILDATRSIDVSEQPTVLGVFGTGGKRDFSKAKVSSLETNQELKDAGFYRPVLIVDEQIKSKEIAEARVRRELSARSRRIDAWDIQVDGWSFWNGREAIPYGVDTLADVVANMAGGVTGAYYITRVVLRRDAASGDSCRLSCIKKGSWVL
jgi:prophage tail gpP-like protein